MFTYRQVSSIRQQHEDDVSRWHPAGRCTRHQQLAISKHLTSESFRSGDCYRDKNDPLLERYLESSTIGETSIIHFDVYQVTEVFIDLLYLDRTYTCVFKSQRVMFDRGDYLNREVSRHDVLQEPGFH